MINTWWDWIKLIVIIALSAGAGFGIYKLARLFFNRILSIGIGAVLALLLAVPITMFTGTAVNAVASRFKTAFSEPVVAVADANEGLDDLLADATEEPGPAATRTPTPRVPAATRTPTAGPAATKTPTETPEQEPTSPAATATAQQSADEEFVLDESLCNEQAMEAALGGLDVELAAVFDPCTFVFGRDHGPDWIVPIPDTVIATCDFDLQDDGSMNALMAGDNRWHQFEAATFRPKGYYPTLKDYYEAEANYASGQGLPPFMVVNFEAPGARKLGDNVINKYIVKDPTASGMAEPAP